MKGLGFRQARRRQQPVLPVFRPQDRVKQTKMTPSSPSIGIENAFLMVLSTNNHANYFWGQFFFLENITDRFIFTGLFLDSQNEF